MTLKTSMTTVEFLSNLFAGTNGLIEVKGIPPKWADGLSITAMYTHSPDEADQFAESIKDSHHVYFGVAPRHLTNSSKESIKEVQCAWADIDNKMFNSRHDAYQMLSLHNSDLPSPTIIVDSGNGFHAYWLYDRPCRDIAKCENVNRHIAARLRGDHTYNANRILRLPGSYNWKDQNNPLAVNIISHNSARYSIGMFGELETPTSVSYSGNLHFALHAENLWFCRLEDLPLNSYWLNLIEYGIDADRADRFKNDRDRLICAVVLKMLYAGIKPEVIAGILLAYNYKISERVFKERNPERYVERKINSCIEYLQQKGG